MTGMAANDIDVPSTWPKSKEAASGHSGSILRLRWSLSHRARRSANLKQVTAVQCAWAAADFGGVRRGSFRAARSRKSKWTERPEATGQASRVAQDKSLSGRFEVENHREVNRQQSGSQPRPSLDWSAAGVNVPFRDRERPINSNRIPPRYPRPTFRSNELIHLIYCPHNYINYGTWHASG